jgi:hypothetical protein
MQETVSAWVVGVMMAVFGFLGLLLGSGALDIEMSIFGYSLTGFAVCFIFGLLRRHYDEVDARASVPVTDHV